MGKIRCVLVDATGSGKKRLMYYNQADSTTVHVEKEPMPTLNLKPTHKSVKDYYAALDDFARLGVTHETAVRAAFQKLLDHCARQVSWTLVPEHAVNPRGSKRVVVDGQAIKQPSVLTYGCLIACPDFSRISTLSHQ